MRFYLNISDDSFAKYFEIVGIVFVIFNGDIKETQLLIDWLDVESLKF